MGSRDGINLMHLIVFHALTFQSLQILMLSVQGGHIDLLISDHSPSVPELKRLDDGYFLKAWGQTSELHSCKLYLPCDPFFLCN